MNPIKKRVFAVFASSAFLLTSFAAPWFLRSVFFTTDDLRYLSPYIHRHINRFGKYRVNLGERPKVMDLETLHGGFLSHHRPPVGEVEQH